MGSAPTAEMPCCVFWPDQVAYGGLVDPDILLKIGRPLAGLL